LRATCAVTVVLSTFNRASMLPAAIASVLQQHGSTLPYELIVVDNNSTDETRQVVRTAQRADARLRYVFETQQGLSHARNAGLDHARAPIVAFTDDDVRVAPTWVEVIHQAFDAHPDVQCVGGRTLPVWPSPPPAWLTPEHWVGPLALQDYGDHPRIIDASRPLCLAGANFAFRKDIFDRLGRFSVDYPRAQDTEFLLRLYRAGFRALYLPEMLVHAAVEPDRLTKAYHRRWHANIGRCNARMRFQELTDPVVGLRAQVPHLRRVLGIPTFAVRQFAGEVWECARHTLRGDESHAFLHETRARALFNYMRESRAMFMASRATPPIATARSQ
jgi:glucosyl-dolichyl phosphate glucuronosyltransferase